MKFSWSVFLYPDKNSNKLTIRKSIFSHFPLQREAKKNREIKSNLDIILSYKHLDVFVWPIGHDLCVTILSLTMEAQILLIAFPS